MSESPEMVVFVYIWLECQKENQDYVTSTDRVR